MVDESYRGESAKEAVLDKLLRQIIDAGEKCIVWTSFIENVDEFTDLGLKIIPFCTVTGQWEIMAGFDAERLEIDVKSYGKNDFVIAVSGYSFSDNFDGIINPEILTGGIKNEVDNKILAEV